MNGIKIFTQDEEIIEDIQDLQTLIEDETNVFKCLYEHLIYRNTLPQDFKDYNVDDLMLHDVEFAAQKSAAILFSSFFLILKDVTGDVNDATVHVIQFDKETSDIFVYNLPRKSRFKDITDNILEMVQDVGELAQGAECYSPLAYKTSFQSFLKFMLSAFESFKDITDDDIDAICFYMGYNTFNKKVLN